MSTSKCRSCGAEIVWLKTKLEKFMPVDAGSLTSQEQSAVIGKMEIVFDHTRHKSHFATCPNANKHRKS